MISFFSKQGEVRTTNCQLDTGWGMCYKHDECSNWFGSKPLAMFLLQKVSSSGYTLGCYYDPFPPYHLSGVFHHFEANLSVAACVKLCGEDGYMLAGLRWRLLTQTSLCMIRVPLQGPSILPLWKRWAPNWPLCGIRDVWGRMPPVGVDPGVFCRPLGNDHVWTLWQIPLHYGKKGFLSNLYDILTDLFHLLHKLRLLGVYNWWGARIRTALCLSLHWDWRVGIGQFNLSIFVDLYLKVGHMVTGLFSGKRPTSRGEYDSYTLRWGVS